MCVTQAAVSRQIRTLEEALDVKLFRRLHRAVELTPEGKRFFQAVTMGLGHIANAAQEISGSALSGQIVVAATSAFATYWLMPRVHAFQKAYPNIEVRTLALDRNPNLDSDEIDVAFTCGTSGQLGHDCTYLFDEVVFPVCSPQYLQENPQLNGMEDFSNEHLLHLDDTYWKGLDWEPFNWHSWMILCGKKALAELPGLRFDYYTMVVQATIEGRGVALGWQHLVEQLIERDLLVRPCTRQFNLNRSYYLSVSRDRSNTGEIATFRDWILASIKNRPES
jgi:DNA-binding transcriptional LysR family regulator